MANKAAVHTLNITHTISKMEMCRICRRYACSDNWYEKMEIADTRINGIKKLIISKNPKYKVLADGSRSFDDFTYTLNIEVNVGKLLSISRVAMTEINSKNMFRMMMRLQEILGLQLQLDQKNCNLETWTLVRVDVGFDLKIPYQDLREMQIYMRLMHYSINLENNRKCQLWNETDREDILDNSLTFFNKLYRYNIYIKFAQFIKGQKPIQEEYMYMDGTIRFEKQLTSKKIGMLMGSPQKLKLLLDETVSEKVFRDVKTDLEVFFGSGKYVTYEEGIRVIEESRCNDASKEYMKIVYTYSTKYGFPKLCEDARAAAKKQGMGDSEIESMIQNVLKYRRNIEKLGISVAGIWDEEAQRIQQSSLKGINQVIAQVVVNKDVTREKGKFAKFSLIQGRWCCQPTIHNFDGKGVRGDFRRKERADAEQDVLDALYDSFKNNYFQIVQGDVDTEDRIIRQSLYELVGFREQIITEKVIERTELLIHKLRKHLNTLEV